MARKKQATLLGFNRTFEVSPECRPYTLRDNGFQPTRNGNFAFERKLDSTNKAGLVLKVMVSKDLENLRISTVNNKGFNSVNIMNLADNDMVVEKVNFIFDGFVERNVLVEVDK
ncbi:cysteine desulfurase [Dolosicoccus paucivorans]|uniref:Cysteine desulfurase n=1 Tax=Dolosicoccus paucivorans TaxID=84521 RepID=A0A1G8J965_9LACT|nr:cysteine desulfurase [Dolosicoccus paucivorans]PMB84590.1 cysteine desulfurase [Dolosicoccus paucivorans]PMC58155.1 cysteine desulfurase [Dolosicoccus paucivorans]SDI27798.1 Putative amino acid metabolism [Dolosicoccus paucivorans]